MSEGSFLLYLESRGGEIEAVVRAERGHWRMVIDMRARIVPKPQIRGNRGSSAVPTARYPEYYSAIRALGLPQFIFLNLIFVTKAPQPYLGSPTCKGQIFK